MLGLVKAVNKDVTSLALGMDLTTLGLNLNSPDPLFSTFGCPWSDTPAVREPQFTLPACYTFVTPPSLKPGHFEKFTLETLLFVFYSSPRDTMQWLAATELYDRKWRYHKDNKMWFSNNPDLLKSMNAPPDSYCAFDVLQWNHVVVSASAMASLLPGLMSDEELRKPA